MKFLLHLFLIESFIICSTIFSQAGSCPPGMIGYWRMDDTIPGFYKDHTGINNGTSDAPPSLVYGLIAGAMHFNGVNNKIDVPANTSFNFEANESFSVEFWYSGYNMPATPKVIIGRYIPATGARWLVGLEANTGRVRFYISDGSSSAAVTGSSLISQGMVHVAATRDGKSGIMKIYVNGNLQGSTIRKFTRGVSSPNANLNIGYLNRQSNTYLYGELDEVALYKSVLPDSAIIFHSVHGYWDRLGYCPGAAPEAPVIISKPTQTKTVTYQGFNYGAYATGEPAPKFYLIKGPREMDVDERTGVVQWIPSVAGKFDVTIEANNGINPPARQSFTIDVEDQNVCPQGMVSYWNMDEKTGGFYADLGGVNNAAAKLPPLPVAGIINGAQQFDGNPLRVINAAGYPDFDFSLKTDFSVEYWYKGNSIPVFYKSAVGRYLGNSDMWYVGLDRYTGKARFFISDGDVKSIINGSIITDGNWHHIAAVWKGTIGNARLYVDGILTGTANVKFTKTFSSRSAKLNIGWLGYDGNFTIEGVLDEIAIYRRELTLAEVQQHYSNGLNGITYCNLLVIHKKVQEEQASAIIPADYQLFQNYPNPFNPITKIRFTIPEQQVVSIKVYNQLGEEVTELVNQLYSPGNYEVEFNGNNLASGLYFYRMNAGAFSMTKKLMLIK